MTMMIPSAEKLRPHLIPLSVIVLATAVVYGRLLGHDFQNLDDPLYVTLNPAVAGFSWQHIKTVFSTFYVGNYAPVQMISYMLDYTLWGLRPGGFLLTNIAIHTINGVAYYSLLLRFHGSRMLASVAAAVFALHPVQVESVAWISQRKNLLAMLFFLAAWEFYRRYRERTSGRRALLYFLSLSAYILALLTKSIAVIFPVVIFIYDYCYPDCKPRFRLLDKLPYILAAGAIAAVTMYSQLPGIGEGGRSSGLHGGSVSATVFTMLPVFCRYLGMIVWPSSLSAEYNPPVYQSPDLVVISSLIVFSAVLWCGWLIYRHDRRLGFWAAFFFVAFLPVSQIVPIYTLINDRYLYFPLLAVGALVGAGAARLEENCRKYPRLVYLPILLPLVALSFATFSRAAIWRDSVTLWSDAAAKVDGLARIWGNLGNAYDAANKRGPALTCYKHGLDLDPNDIQILYNLGTLYMLLGDNSQAYGTLNKLLTLVPNHVMGLVSMGDTCVQLGDFTSAEKSYQRAYQLQPNAADPLVKLGNIAVIMNRLEDALGYYLKAEKLGGLNPDIAYNIACIESMANRTDSSLLWLDKALQRGYHDEYTLRTNQELVNAQNDRRFEKLLERYFPKSR